MNALALRTRPAWDVDRYFDRWMDRWVREFFGPATADDWFGGSFTPAAEIVRDGDDALVRIELPGVDVDKDVHVEVDRGYLVVHGERRDERADDRDGRVLREVRYGSFRRSFKLPEHVTSDMVSASYDAGVLTVRVAGAHKSPETKRIAIEAK
ncbi:hsp20/alpha crystallin family protein [Mycolicibacterium hassiacum DSM 44199]|jgi:HSP20 family molecular chaperone IbpA|uniref:Hsp20/alpha crystallin family protein n=1 Tax=Mycolicibacterium hassiacum (strain DSM 44199 / CIP 105218 / JCM 12690 / 3849) TaxID=1122247 RepID=K5B9I0_MYCHD|nr:Hsp20/alpha crystallin family protein [Mycolicibacterium hassiacum]EKF25483.1 hsp20/alpha crystallin family protein [Mycolicibacterium hassiacum DSM 44199]MDA4086660.1 heat shock protein Hsp20 [Mycolicibacterium hassiacum DSM 44199]VCT92856.1 Alpha-crystallin [Mycolicibacterium hassiacum DSM 44199]